MRTAFIHNVPSDTLAETAAVTWGGRLRKRRVITGAVPTAFLESRDGGCTRWAVAASAVS